MSYLLIVKLKVENVFNLESIKSMLVKTKKLPLIFSSFMNDPSMHFCAKNWSDFAGKISTTKMISRENADKISSLMGTYLLQGYTLLDDYCNSCKV